MYKTITYIIVGLLLVSCNKSSDTQEHDHEHEEEVLSYTLFSGGNELFVEFSPLVVGQTSEFIAHFTRLIDYKPVEQGELAISLIKDVKGIKHNVNESSVPGIYRPSLQPKEAGTYRLLFELTSPGGNINFEVKEIEVYANHELVHKQATQIVTGDEISFLKEQAWKTDFATMQIERKAFRELIITSGQILPANGDETTIVAPYSGLVVLGSSLMEGKEVATGETLLSLSGKGLASDNISVHYTELKTEYELAKANFERLEKLIDDKIVTEGEYLKAKAEYEQARVAFKNVEQSGKESLSNVKANLSGFVKDIKVTDGQYVEAGTALVSIAQNKKLILQADVSQSHWHCLPEIEEANFITPYESTVYNTSELKGKLVSYSRNATKSAWSTPVYFEINNWGDLIPGTYVEIFLLSQPVPNVIAIPMSALVEEQSNFYVFVQLTGETYEKRQVKAGINNGREIEIVSGLKQGDVIVTRGAYQIKLASMSSAIPGHGHDH